MGKAAGALGRLADALINVEVWYVIPFGLLPLYFSVLLPDRNPWWALPVVLAPWGLRWMRWGSPSQRTPLDVPVILFVLGAFVGLYPSLELAVSLERLWGILGAVFTYYLVVNNRTEGHVRAYLLIGFLVSLVAVVWVVGQSPFGDEKLNRLGGLTPRIARLIPKFTGYAPHANGLAGLLVVLAPFGVALSLMDRPRWWGLLWVPLTLAVLFALFWSNSRSGLLATGAAMAVMGIARSRWLLVPVGLGAVAGSILFSSHLWGPTSVWTRAEGASTVGRLAVWESSYYMIQEFAYTGIGLGMFPLMSERYALPAQPGFVNNPHNAYIQTYLDQGVLGFVALLFILFGATWMAMQALRVAGRGDGGTGGRGELRTQNPEPRTLSITHHSSLITHHPEPPAFDRLLPYALVGALVAFSVHAFFEASLTVVVKDSSGVWHSFVSPLLWVVIGMAAPRMSSGRAAAQD